MKTLSSVCFAALLIGWLLFETVGADERNGTGIVQYGEMHLAIGRGQDQGRIQLGKLTKKANFFGVAALAGLEGEVTIRDGKITATVVDESGRLKSADGRLEDKQATLLVGAYVPKWTRVMVTKDVTPHDFDAFVAEMAESAGVSTDKPFVFTVEGKLVNVRMHVINGACPIRARIKNIELANDQQPYEKEIAEIDGSIVAIFAKNAVGKLTHPDTMTHGHILYREPSSDTRVTGHLESVGLRQGAVLKFPHP